MGAASSPLLVSHTTPASLRRNQQEMRKQHRSVQILKRPIGTPCTHRVGSVPRNRQWGQCRCSSERALRREMSALSTSNTSLSTLLSMPMLCKFLESKDVGTCFAVTMIHSVQYQPGGSTGLADLFLSSWQTLGRHAAKLLWEKGLLENEFCKSVKFPPPAHL